MDVSIETCSDFPVVISEDASRITWREGLLFWVDMAKNLLNHSLVLSTEKL